jgi:hypothetical protein
MRAHGLVDKIPGTHRYQMASDAVRMFARFPVARGLTAWDNVVLVGEKGSRIKAGRAYVGRRLEVNVMKRGLGAAVLTVVLATGQAGADYVRLKVDIKNATPYPAAATAPGVQGVPGAPGGARPPAFGNKGGGRPVPGGQPGIPAAPGAKKEEDHLWITVYLDLKGKPEYKANVGRIKIIKINHQFGKDTYVPIPPLEKDGPPPFLEAEWIQKGSLVIEHEKRLRKLQDSTKAKDLVDLAFWDWSHGLMKEFHATIDELKKRDAKHPVVAAYHKVQSQLKAPLADTDPALKSFLDEARSENYRPTVSDKGHYALYSNRPPDQDNNINTKRRLARLEDALESFYYWFALQDNMPIPAMPRYRLLGFVMDDPSEFYKSHKSWGNQPMLASGFTPRRQNIMILSAKRLDDVYGLVENWTGQWMQQRKLGPHELLNGEVWRRSDAKPNALAFAIIQTIAVIQKAMDEEAERTTLSHEAVRQLLAATGLLPHNVAVPEWIQEGVAAYFERPFGAVYGAGGLPSWSNLVAFKHYKPGLGKSRDILLNVLNDRYFQIARHDSEGLEEGREKPEKTHEDWERARATSWALVYYLDKQQKMDRLFSYANELAQMPRDLELDQGALEGSFAKAFSLGDGKNARNLDRARLQDFADNWLEYMKTVSLELPGEEVESLKTRKANSSPSSIQPAPPSQGPAESLPPPPSN